MEENRSVRKDDLLDTTDCLEAVSVFRGWKNFLFIVIFCCLVVQQVVFWSVDLGWVKAEEKSDVKEAQKETPAVSPRVGPFLPGAGGDITVELPSDINDIGKAAGEVAPEPNVPGETKPGKFKLFSEVRFVHAAWVIRLVDFVLIMVSMMYCLTLLFSLKVSLLGRLGGINHISRAFFLSLVFLVLILPWQKLFGPAVKGEIFLPDELLAWLKWYGAEKGRIFAGVVFYLRFTGYWVIVMVVLFLSVIRGSRWTRATLRRLEIV